jgi:hypothetical protein
VDASQKFLIAGEAFAGTGAGELRAAVMSLCASFFEGHHRANMEALGTLLAQERWQSMPGGEAGAAAGASIGALLKEAAASAGPAEGGRHQPPLSCAPASVRRARRPPAQPPARWHA